MDMENRNDRILDTLIETAADDAAFQAMHDMPSCEDLDKIYKPSLEMDKRMRGIISRIENEKRFNRLLSLIGKIAAAFLVLVIITTTVLFSVEASRNYIFNAFLEWNKKNTTITFTDDSTQNEFDKYSINYIPNGFTISNIDNDDISRFYTYINDKNVIIYITLTYAESVKLGVDNENTKQSIIMINNNKAYLFESIKTSGMNILVWNDGKIAFEITSIIRTDELIKIADNIVKN